MTNIQGHCDPAFAAVKTAFAENFETRGEVGATCSVIVGGKTVVDIWGGHMDSAKTTAWAEDSMSLVFSCTKVATALCAHILIDQGKMDLDAKVTKYWPEFGQNGKEDVTVRMMLCHQSALPALRAPVKPGGYYDFDYMAERLAAEEPFWEPGTDNGYHMLTFGWTVGELVRRVSGQGLSAFFKESISGPLGLDFHIGLPDADFARTAKMIPFVPDPALPPSDFLIALMTDRDSASHLSLMNSGSHYFDGPDAWRAEIGGGGGISNARAMAKMMNALLGDTTLISKERIDDLRKLAAQTDRDRTLLCPTRFGQGVMLKMDNPNHPGGTDSFIIGDGAFGHVGMGGSTLIADPEVSMSFAYSMTNMGGGMRLNDRGQSLVDAAYSCL